MSVETLADLTQIAWWRVCGPLLEWLSGQTKADGRFSRSSMLRISHESMLSVSAQGGGMGGVLCKYLKYKYVNGLQSRVHRFDFDLGLDCEH